MFYESRKCLNDTALLTLLQAAVDKALSLQQPQCIVVVDASGEVLIQFRMTGSKFLSLKSAHAKALTAASVGLPSNRIPEHVRPAIAAATDGGITGLPGGLPISFEGELVGGIGVGSGSGEQDIAVALAALKAISADPVTVATDP